MRVAIDPGEAHGFHIYFLGDYARAEIDACIDLCGGGRWFADIGANIGLVSLAVARACPHVQVLAVEPDAALCDWLRLNLSLNLDLTPRVSVLQAAAIDVDGEVAFARNARASNIGTGHLVAAGETAGAVAVAGVAIGRYAERRGMSLDVVKIDVEGGEQRALAGIWTSQAPPRALLIETHAFSANDPHDFNQRLLDDLARHGYAVERLGRGRWRPVTGAADIGPRAHLRCITTNNT